MDEKIKAFVGIYFMALTTIRWQIMGSIRFWSAFNQDYAI